ncbi:MAG: SRPBCC family protein [Cyanobacteria bacterium P01_H01_bin.58]
MPFAISLDQLTRDLNAAEQNHLQQGDVVLVGSQGSYAVWGLIKAQFEVVWEVLTAYEDFPSFLPSVVSARILEQRDNRTIVERQDRRKVGGWMPIKVKIVTENIEVDGDRIDYRMLDGTLDSMLGSWRVIPVDSSSRHPQTLLVQTIAATANMGPLQGYFYEVFEQGLRETMADLRIEIERRSTSLAALM